MAKPAKLYQFAVIATDITIFTVEDGALKVLLIKMNKSPFEDCWAAPGGLIQIDESVDQAAKRILAEKTGLKQVYLEQLYTFGEVKRDPFGRVVSVAYFALISSDGLKLATSDEHREISWFSVNELPKLAYDHKAMIRSAIERLRGKLEYTNIVYSLLPDAFTLSELQSAYETILGRTLDKRNFRKKVLSLGMIRKTGKLDLGKKNRPAELYSFIEKKLKNIEIL
ncbi:NUDIX hydrolase [Candidatus Falkowbacteria bacterium]|nr:NUDIX hydrolase [Candidatus Falkowbacteria bacterium]